MRWLASLALLLALSASAQVIPPRPLAAGFSGGTSSGITFNYFIAASGCSDSNNGTAVGTPWCITSLQDSNANNASLAGKNVCLLQGTYDITSIVSGSFPSNYSYPALSLPPGNSSAQTYLAACNSSGRYSRGAAELTCTTARTSVNSIIGQDAFETGYFTIDGILYDGQGAPNTETDGCPSEPINLYPANGNGLIEVENSEIRNIYFTLTSGDNYAAIYLTGEDLASPGVSMTVTNDYFHDINANSVDGLHTHAFLCYDCNSSTSITLSTFAYNQSHLDCKENCAGVTLADDYFGPIGPASGGAIVGLSALLGFDGAELSLTNTANVIRNNVFDGAGMALHPDVNSYIEENLDWENNTTYDVRSVSGSNGATIYMVVQGGGNTLYSFNNIVVTTSITGAAAGQYALGAPGTWTQTDYNCFGFATPTDGWGAGYPSASLYSSLSAWKASADSPDAHSLSGSATYPAFASSITVGNSPSQYELSGGSPCKGTGQSGQDMGAWGGSSPPGQIGASWVSYPVSMLLLRPANDDEFFSVSEEAA